MKITPNESDTHRFESRVQKILQVQLKMMALEGTEKSLDLSCLRLATLFLSRMTTTKNFILTE